MVTDDTFDVVIVGASIAGSTAAALYGREGASVALVERNPDPDAYKTVCTTYIQAHATPVFERLGLTDRLEEAGAVRNDARIWTRWGWIHPELDSGFRGSRHGYNLRRETLDPMLRDCAARTPGVQTLLGHTATDVVRSGERVDGVIVRDRAGTERALRARIVVGADGRDSRTAKLARVPGRRRPNDRFGYFAQYRGIELADGATNQMWMLDPEVAYAFLLDDGVVILVAMPRKERLAEFRADPEPALLRTFAQLPGAPSLATAERVTKVIGKLDMPNIARPPARPGLAFVGDAAMACDPLWGVGCGFALSSASWLVDATAPALASGDDVDVGLQRYARRHRRELTGAQLLMNDFATGRKLNPVERLMFSAAARDNRTATHLFRYGSRQIGPAKFLSPRALARAGVVNARHRVAA